jgi:hypothetical protein
VTSPELRGPLLTVLDRGVALERGRATDAAACSLATALR